MGSWNNLRIFVSRRGQFLTLASLTNFREDRNGISCFTGLTVPNKFCQQKSLILNSVSSWVIVGPELLTQLSWLVRIFYLWFEIPNPIAYHNCKGLKPLVLYEALRRWRDDDIATFWPIIGCNGIIAKIYWARWSKDGITSLIVRSPENYGVMTRSIPSWKGPLIWQCRRLGDLTIWSEIFLTTHMKAKNVRK